MKNALAWIRRRVNLGYVAAVAVSIFAALLIDAFILLAAGHNPIAAYRELFVYPFSTAAHFGNMLEYAMVLCLCGLACVVGSRAGIFNVGGEGQLLLGGLVAAYVGSQMSGMSLWIVIPCAALAAMATGGLYAFIPGVLKVKLKVNEVITTIMLNSVAGFICSFFSSSLWKNTRFNEGIDVKEFRFATLIPGSKLSTAILASALITFLVWYVLEKTSKGYEMRLIGDNPRFARFAGLKTDRIVILAMVVSGMMCGLVGMFRVYGAEKAFISSRVSNEYYFEGLMVAMIAQYQPVPTIVISLIFAILKSGAMGMQSVGVTIQIYWVIQATVIFCMAAQTGIMTAIRKAGQRRAAERDVAARKEGGNAHE
jgi:simple sugar transport system permease protein